MNIQVRPLSPSACEIIVPPSPAPMLKTLIISDVHYDSSHCDRATLKRHLDEALEQDAAIFVIGDWFDVMGCHKDPRSKAADIRPEYIQKRRSYLDLVIDDSFEFLKPYRENIAMMSMGNHETAILKHRDTDPLERLVNLLNQGTRLETFKGAYSGNMVIKMNRSSGGGRCVYKIGYHHGKGGGAKRSKGVLGSQIDAMMYPDCDMLISGHDHNKLHDPSNVRFRFNERTGKTYQDAIEWLKLGTYKMTRNDFGYEVEKGYMPSRMGGWFVDFKLVREYLNGKELAYIDSCVREAKPLRVASAM